MKIGIRGEILKKCVNERKKDEKENVWSNVNKRRKEYLWRCGMNEDEFEKIGRKVEEVRERDIEVQGQKTYNRIVNAKYNKRYRELRTMKLPRYIIKAKNKKKGLHQGNSESKVWK